MKYPSQQDPFNGSHHAFLAWLFGALAAAHSIIAQYERAESESKETAFLRDLLSPRDDDKQQ